MSHMIIGWVFALFGLVFVGVSIAAVVTTIRDRRRLQTWTPSTAIIREIEKRIVRNSTGPGSRTQLIAHYDYRGPHGEEYADEGLLQSQRFATDGSPRYLQILIDPVDPNRSIIAGEPASIGCAVTVAIIFAALGSFFALIGFVFAGAGLG